jgi:hypothetical protein
LYVFDAKTQPGIPAGAQRSDLTHSPHQFNRPAVQIKTRDDIAPRELQAKHIAVEADGSVEIRNAIIDCRSKWSLIAILIRLRRTGIDAQLTVSSTAERRSARNETWS